MGEPYAHTDRRARARVHTHMRDVRICMLVYAVMVELDAFACTYTQLTHKRQDTEDSHLGRNCLAEQPHQRQEATTSATHISCQ